MATMNCSPCMFAMPLALGLMVTAQVGPGWGLLAGLAFLAFQFGLTKVIGRGVCPAETAHREAAARHPQLARPVVDAGIRAPRP